MPIKAIPPDHLESVIADIDLAAGVARGRFVSYGDFVTEEYRQAATKVQQWRTAGSPVDAVPQEIIDGAFYDALTPDAAATNISQTAYLFDESIRWIRTVRLYYKGVARSAAGDGAESQRAKARTDANAAFDEITIAAVAGVLQGAPVPANVAHVLAQVDAAVASMA